ncbi:hypothetical protein B0H13DRAFT_1890551 [Mycena leptocephala]|nr:hypothetical protein B0H13DRAFT_1890551 [Mycena leptocephala]
MSGETMKKGRARMVTAFFPMLSRSADRLECVGFCKILKCAVVSECPVSYILGGLQLVDQHKTARTGAAYTMTHMPEKADRRKDGKRERTTLWPRFPACGRTSSGACPRRCSMEHVLRPLVLLDMDATLSEKQPSRNRGEARRGGTHQFYWRGNRKMDARFRALTQR